MASNITRLALVISQEEFEIPGVQDREGNEHDVKQLESTLSMLGFVVRNFENLKKQEILNTLTSICVESYKNLECILVIVLSHGDKEGVLYAKDQEFYTKDVWGPFRETPKFNDIPKIFIFQACRGLNEEKTFLLNSPATTKQQQNNYAPQMVPVLPQKSGFLLVHSTIEGHISKRNHDTGTIFIQTLCNEMSFFHNKYGAINFLSLLTEVNNKVTTTTNTDLKSQTSTFTSFLRQPLILITENAVNAENNATFQVSNDAQGGDIKTSYENKGKNIMLLLYTEKYEKQYTSLRRVLNHFAIISILVKSIEDIYGLSRSNIFENVCSFTVIVLAEMSEARLTDYCEKHFVEFSRLMVQPNDIWYQFTAYQCEHLRGKPKLFFFFDLHDRHDSPEIDMHQVSQNIESVNNHSDFIWTYCYGNSMFDEMKRALTDPCEEITQLLTTAMRRAESTARSKSRRSSHFESTLRLQFYYQSPKQEKLSLHPRESVLPDLNVTTIPDMNLTIVPDLKVTTVPDLNVTTTPDLKVTTEPDLNVTTVPDLSVTTVPDLSVTTIPDLKVTTEPDLNVTTVPDLSVTTVPDLNVTTTFRLVTSSSPVNADGDTDLHIATRNGDVTTMQFILERNLSSLNLQNNMGFTPLHIACDNGKTEDVKFLLSKKDCSVNICDIEGNSVLNFGSWRGCVEIMQLILQRDQSLLNKQNNRGSTPLHQACRNGMTEAVKFLLSYQDCSLNICDKYGDTVLHDASRQGYVEIMQLVLQRDQSLLNKQNNSGSTPLHQVCRNGKTKAVKFLLSLKDCAVKICDKDGDTVLHDASRQGYVQIMKNILLRDQSLLNKQNIKKNTPLHEACRNGKTEAVKFLLSYKDCSVNICDQYGDTALHDASYGGSIKIIQQILHRDNSLLNMQNDNGYTPMHTACLNNKTEAVQFFLSHNDCSVNICDNDGDSVLHLGCWKGYVGVMRLILQRDQSLLNMQNDNGSTPLHTACLFGNTEAVEFLLSYSDCSVNICDEYVDTVLHHASCKGYVEIMQLILQRDQSLLNKQNKDGYTPLHQVCRNGKTEAAKLLLSQTGCFINARDYSNSGHTAFDFAQKNGHNEIIKLLLRHGTGSNSRCTCL